MKSKLNSKVKTIIVIGILLTFFASIIHISNPNINRINNCLECKEVVNYNEYILRTSKVSAKIHIANNWSEAKVAGICTGLGTFSDPYIIEDLAIDGYGSGSCILIENSDSYVKIENCTLFNSIDGIRLSYTQNVQVFNNTCSSHMFGISLYYSLNNSISENIAFDNEINGISLLNSDENNISGNFEHDNFYYGISLFDSDNNVILNNVIHSGLEIGGIYNNISGNLMKECGIHISDSNTENYYFQYIDISNLVNEKPIYYYTNKQYLGPNNFTDAGQIIMASCSDSLVKNVNLSCTDTGLTLINCHDNRITKNSINSNQQNGIYIFGGENNTLSNNTAFYNMQNGILLEYSINNLCIDNNISHNNYNGIYCHRLESSVISRNNINNNKRYGIRFSYCINNTITENSLIENEECFYIDSLSEGNTFQDNICRNRAPSIFGYNIFVFFGILVICTIILSKRLRNQKPNFRET